MALQKQPITIPILGLDTHSDPKSAPPGSCDLAENVYYRRLTAGGVESRKRNGATPRTRNILGGGTITNARKIVEYGGEQLLVADTQLYSWSSIAGAWVAKGYLTPIGLTGVPVADSLTSRFAPDAAVGGGYACFIATSEDFGTHLPLKVTVIDLSTGVRVLADVSSGLTTGDTPNGKVVALANSFVIVSLDAGVLSAVSIAFAAPQTIGAPVVVANNAATHGPWDMVRSGTADQALVAYNGSGANQLRCLQWNSNMTVGSSLLFAEQPNHAIGWLYHDYLDGHAYLAYVDSTRGARMLDITLAGFAAAGSGVDATTTASGYITGFRSGGANTFLLEVTGAPAYKSKIRRSTGAAFADWQLGAGLWSRIFVRGTSHYVAVCYSDALQDKYFILDATGATPHVVATAFDGLAGQGGFEADQLASVPAISSAVFAVPVQVFTDNIQDPTNGTQAQVGIRYLRLDFAPVLSTPKQIGGALILPGAIVRQYDGQTTTELGFPVFPIVVSAVQSGGGSITLLSTIELVATYLWLDAHGQEHRSSPSAPLEVTMSGANNKLTISVTNLRIGDKPAPVFVELWATANGSTTLALQLQVANDPTVDTTTFVMSTNANLTHGDIYTTGRALPHNAFPPASLIEVWRDRAFFAQTDESNQLWVSDEIEDGLGLAVSQANVLPLPTDDGDVTSLNEFDDRVLIGKAAALYQLSGSGPAANGDGQYQSPSRINSVSGPTSQNGVVKTTNGLIFKSSHGHYLLPRGGADPVRLLNVEGYDSLTLTGASNVDTYEQTRIVTAEGRTLVYHYGLPDERGIGRWSTFTGQAAVDCANFGGAWCYLSSDGTVHVETAGQYADDGVAYVRNERFTWLTAGGQFGNVRLYAAQMLGEVLANCTITATVAYDDDSTVVDTLTKAVTPSTKGALEFWPSRGRADAVQFAISETSTGEGYRLTAIGLEIGTKPGFSKQAAGAFLT